MFGFKQKKQGNRKVKLAHNLKERAQNKKIKPFFMVSLFCVLAMATVLIHNRLNQHILFPITQISVVGELKNIKEASLKSLVLNDLKQGFFDVDLNTFAQEIEAINWVAKATLRRVWPNQIEILIKEHQAIAIWDDKTLISTNGILFEVGSIDAFQHLALVTGKKMNAKTLLLAYSELDHLTAHYGLQVVEVKRVKSGEMTVTFNTKLYSIFALQDKKIQFKRFVSLLESGFIKVENNLSMMNEKPLKSIDMRYSNGFSVVWEESQLNKQKVKEPMAKSNYFRLAKSADIFSEDHSNSSPLLLTSKIIATLFSTPNFNRFNHKLLKDNNGKQHV